MVLEVATSRTDAKCYYCIIAFLRRMFFSCLLFSLFVCTVVLFATFWVNKDVYINGENRRYGLCCIMYFTEFGGQWSENKSRK